MASGTSYRPPGTLPPQTSGFVGREAELARARELLRQSRLVTITGPGGVGKTRLAVRAAGVAAGGFRDGAHFIELSAVHDPGLLAHTLAARLTIASSPTPSSTRDPSWTGCSASFASATCCSSSTPASTSSTRARRWQTASSARPRGHHPGDEQAAG
jgi:hypothetical protein